MIYMASLAVTTIAAVCESGSFEPFVYIQMRSFYQDRLGTNIWGNSTKTAVFSQVFSIFTACELYTTLTVHMIDTGDKAYFVEHAGLRTPEACMKLSLCGALVAMVRKLVSFNLFTSSKGGTDHFTIKTGQKHSRTLQKRARSFEQVAGVFLVYGRTFGVLSAIVTGASLLIS